MKTRAIIGRWQAFALASLLGASGIMAQSYYDDDIYYDASKAKKETKKVVKQALDNRENYQQAREQQYYYDGAEYVPWNNVGEFQSADKYAPAGTSTRDVDEYNRRTPAKAQTAQAPDSITLQQFEEMSNTRNLARFHNSEVAKEAYAENYGENPEYAAAMDYSTIQQPQSTVNINLYGGFGYPYYDTFYSNPWAWNNWGYYDPWWGFGYGPVFNYWGPSWSWSWGWGPSWSWGGPGWGWGYPGWGAGWGPGWGGPVWSGPAWGGGYHPTYTSSGAYRPNRPASGSSNGNYRPNTSSGRYTSNGTRGSIYNSNGLRPSTTAGNRGSMTTGTTRPGYRQPTARPSGTVNSNATTAPTRGRGGYYPSQGTTTNTNRNNSYNNSNSSNNRYTSPTPSYNSGTRGRSSSSGSFGSGRSSGGSSGGHRGR